MLRSSRLLYAMNRLGSSAWSKLRSALTESGLEEVIPHLNVMESAATAHVAPCIERLTLGGATARTDSVETEDDADEIDRSVAFAEAATISVADGGCVSRPKDDPALVKLSQDPKSKLISHRSMLKVKPTQDPKVGAGYYPMTKLPRGTCLIINNEHFHEDEKDELKEKADWKRLGSEEESQFLADVFRQLGFRVKPMRNLTAQAMENFLSEESQDPTLATDEALVVIIMSHGG